MPMDPREYLNHSAAADGSVPVAGPSAAQLHSPAPAPAPAPIPTPAPAPASKIVSRNTNGTLVLTSTPGNEAELQLYRVMQRASLLAYYDTLLEMGGDDVQQLCDAGEEEFLEIMALVGMASKPLHVRRLQKALQEWVSNPGLFQTPLLPTVAGIPVAFPVNLSPQPHLAPLGPSPPAVNSHCSPGGKEPSPGHTQVVLGEYSNHGSTSCPMPSPGRGPSTSTSPGPPGSPLQLTPVLLEAQVARLAEAADQLIRSLPQFEPKPHNGKKKICKDLENVMNMAEDDPRRMEEIRKYAAIYGRFDCKRKPEKPLTLHEVSVNEAAAQICKYMPALLTRRDELFPLARQVVRDSGYHYSKGHSNLSASFRSHPHGLGGRSNGDEIHGGGKRPCLESIPSLSPSQSDFMDLDTQHRYRRQERLEQIADELRTLGERTEELVVAAQQVRELNDYPTLHSLQQQIELIQNKQTMLLQEQNDLLSRQQPYSRYYRRTGKVSSCFDSERQDTDDTDSQFSFSNASSPSQEVGDSRDSTTRDMEGNGASEIKCSRSPCKISKQLVHDTLLDEGLRVVKEMVASQNKESSGSEGHSSYDSFQESKVQVIASSGGNIIAVANPALSMSPAITPDTSDSPLTPLLSGHVIASSGGNIIAVANPALSMSPAIAPDTSDGSLTPLLRGAAPMLLKQELTTPEPSPSVPGSKLE